MVHYNFPEYVEARDKLIGEAEDYANRVAGLRPLPVGEAESYQGRKEIQEWSDRWTSIFHRKMNALAEEAGLCSDSKE